jgi:hypothetical protein
VRRLLTAFFSVALLAPAWSPPALAQSLPTWLAGSGASGDSTFAGVVDTPAPGANLPTNRIITVTGWVVDTSAQGWTGIDDVRVFLGSMDSGSLVSHPTVGLARPDVAATFGNPFWSTAGWSGPLDTGVLSAGQNTLSVYAHAPDKGWWYTQLTVTTGALGAAAPPLLRVDTPAAEQRVSDRLGSFPVSGFATDPGIGPAGIDYVEVWLNGEENSDTGIHLGTADFDTKSGIWKVEFNPAKVPALPSNLYVYAHSGITGKRTLVVVHFAIVDRPVS